MQRGLTVEEASEAAAAARKYPLGIGSRWGFGTLATTDVKTAARQLRSGEARKEHG